MGEARRRLLSGKPSIGDNWKHLQRDYEDRPVTFKEDENGMAIRHRYIHPAMKRLNRKMRGIDKKFEATNQKAVLVLADLMNRQSRFHAQKERLLKRLNPLAK